MTTESKATDSLTPGSPEWCARTVGHLLLFLTDPSRVVCETLQIRTVSLTGTGVLRLVYSVKGIAGVFGFVRALPKLAVENDPDSAEDVGLFVLVLADLAGSEIPAPGEGLVRDGVHWHGDTTHLA